MPGSAAPGHSLTDQQQAFVDAYCLHRNGAKAAREAGYTHNRPEQAAYELLTNPDIAQAIRQRLDAISESLFITESAILADLWTIKERCMQRAPVLDSDGTETGLWTFDARGALRALELMGRHLGMFGSKLDLRAILTAEARRMAEELGIPEAMAVAEAERVVREHAR